jgi:hypothetical protein
LISLFFDFKNYFEYTFKILLSEGSTRILEYSGHRSNNVLILYFTEIFYNLIFPFKINLLDALYEKSFGRLLFIPFILISYFFIFFSLLNLKKIIKMSFISNHIKVFYLIFISSFLIGILAGRDFTQLTFGIPLISFTVLFFIINKKNNFYLYILTFIFLSTNTLYKYYHSSFYKNIYNEPISTKEISPLRFYNLKSQIDTKHLLDTYDFIKNNNLNEVIFLGHNAKTISFLAGITGLEFDSYYHYNMSKHKERFTYDCKLNGVSNCDTYLINYVNRLKSTHIMISDDFYYHVMKKFGLYLEENYLEIYKNNSISVYEKI